MISQSSFRRRLAHGFAFPLLVLSIMCAPGLLRAENITLSVTDGTTADDDFNGLDSLFFYVPDQDVYLTSFTYLGSDGVTGLASGLLYMGTDWESAYEVPSENPADGMVDSGGVVDDGVWTFESGAVLLNAGQSYSFAISSTSPLSGVGVNGSGPGLATGGSWNNVGAQWWGFAIPKDFDEDHVSYNFRLEVTPAVIPEPATTAISMGLAALGGLGWSRRRALLRTRQG